MTCFKNVKPGNKKESGGFQPIPSELTGSSAAEWGVVLQWVCSCCSVILHKTASLGADSADIILGAAGNRFHRRRRLRSYSACENSSSASQIRESGVSQWFPTQGGWNKNHMKLYLWEMKDQSFLRIFPLKGLKTTRWTPKGHGGHYTDVFTCLMFVARIVHVVIHFGLHM